MEVSQHARDMLDERQLPEEWMWRTMQHPDRRRKDVAGDGNMHYYKRIREAGERVLHVIVNEQRTPPRIVSVFFDRAARRRP
jgi:hypothetical protein